MSVSPAVAPASHLTVRALPDQAPELAQVLARAFFDDPVFAWCFPHASSRLARSERLFAGMFLKRLALPQDETYTTHAGSGAALWMPPDTWDLGPVMQLRLLPLLLRLWGRDLPRVMRGLDVMDQHHPHAPHWYLPILGVDPSRQGEGIGSSLLAPILHRCDVTGMPAYLEATSERNRALYERHGFEVTEEIALPDGPPLWLMWREARA
ncbi:MAG: GNAT family N-acetyltransferase [Solirubrobacteraceae bacterium]|nr:GNAT family N-acetyltransferase [Solirubrobacteraceae bacterium]